MKPRSFLFVLSMLIALVAYADSRSVRVIALFADKALLQVDGKQKVVSKGETYEGVLLQSATGRGAVVVIDGQTMTLDLNQTIAGKFKKRESTSLRIPANADDMFFTRGTINGQSTAFLVDTGASHVTISGRKARSLNIDFKQGLRAMANTASSVVPVWQVSLDSVSIGGIKLNNIPATVIEGEKPTEVLLGNSFLQHTEIRKAGSILVITRHH